MTRLLFTFVSGSLLALSATSFGETSAPPADASPPRSSEANPLPRRDAARHLLNKTVDPFDWQEKPFEEIVQWLEDAGEGRVNVIVRQKALAEAGIQGDAPVTLKLSNTSDTTVGFVLFEVMNQLSTDDDTVEFRAVGNNVYITTRKDNEKRMVVEVYDVTDLLIRIPDFGQSAPQIDLQNVNQRGGAQGGGGGGGGQSVFSGGGGGGEEEEEEETGDQAEQNIEQRMQRLRLVIMGTVAPDSWEDVGTGGGTTGLDQGVAGGGGKGRIRIWNRNFIVYNTPEVHEQLVGWFAFKN